MIVDEHGKFIAFDEETDLELLQQAIGLFEVLCTALTSNAPLDEKIRDDMPRLLDSIKVRLAQVERTLRRMEESPD